jgi:hypothetical protein
MQPYVTKVGEMLRTNNPFMEKVNTPKAEEEEER